jgi:Transposase DDE domain
MVLDEVYRRFVASSPAAVMMRGILENCLSAQRLDDIFEQAAQVQYTRELAFSSVVRLMSQVVTRIQPSVHAAYRQVAEDLAVSPRSLYGKLEHLEPAVSKALLRRTAEDLRAVVEHLQGHVESNVPGFRLKILDGNHLGGTDRRLKPLRNQRGAALPGQSLVVFDPALQLVVDVFPWEDAHAQERALLGQVISTVQSGDLWLADRNFCTTRFLFGVATRQAAFLVRQHQGTLRWELVGRRRACGKAATGRIFEQSVRLLDEQGRELVVRRITLALDRSTRDGQTEIHLLTNMPPAIEAQTIAELYLRRWWIETAFQELTVELACEVNTLGYPKAALFAFCVALLCYNALNVLKAALRSARAKPSRPAAKTPIKTASRRRDELSTYYLAHEISGVWQGLMIMLPDSFWRARFAEQSPAQLALELSAIAHAADLQKYRKRPPNTTARSARSPCQPTSHVATARILAKTKHK